VKWRCTRHPVWSDASACTSSAQIRDLGRFNSPHEVPDSLACGSASGMTGVGGYARFTSMRLDFGPTVALSGLGRLIVSTPSLKAADTLSGVTSKGTVMVRWNAP
jgi:hypothetical protein